MVAVMHGQMTDMLLTPVCVDIFFQLPALAATFGKNRQTKTLPKLFFMFAAHFVF
jgi:hypothetical protein